MKKYDFYIASGFFTEQQIEEIEFIKCELDKRNLTYFSPKDNCVCGNIALKEERQSIFKQNEDAINASRMIICNTNNKDMGTLWEAGYACGKNIPVIYVCFQLGPNGQLNLMLSESGISSCVTREELIQTLDGENFYWNGEIE